MNQNKIKPALIGGACSGVASALPILNLLNCACCLLVVGGGLLASYLYLKDRPPGGEAPYGDGAVVGLLAGLVAAVVNTVLQIPFTLLAAGAGFYSGLEEALESVDLPEEVASAIAALGGGGLSLGFLLFGLVLSLVVYAIFSSVGGLIGAAVFHKKSVA